MHASDMRQIVTMTLEVRSHPDFLGQISMGTTSMRYFNHHALAGAVRDDYVFVLVE